MRFHGTGPDHDLTYADVFLVPSRSSVGSRLDVDLRPDDGTGATIPLVSANMNSVTGPRLAAALARRGGLGILPQDMPLQELDAAIRWVKEQPVAYDTPVRFSPDATVAEALDVVAPVTGAGILVAEDGAEPLGCLDAARLGDELPAARLGDLIGSTMASLDADDLADGRTAFEAMAAAGLDFAPVLSRGRLVGTLSRAGALRSTVYRPAVDTDGRLKVGAAVGMHSDVVGKARALAAAGVDVLVIDTAHGDQDSMREALRAVRDTDLKATLVAGNVVTGQAVRELVEAGADIIKVGVGPGAMCTTRMMTAVGRPQFSAVLETAEAARDVGARVWADGGVRFPRDVALALAAGASSVMIGSWFAGTVESPGVLRRDEAGRLFKESWGMASTRAVEERYGRLGEFEQARKRLFAEGISASRIPVDPHRPSVEDLLDMITTGVRSAFTYTGARTLAQFRQRAVVGVQSAAGYEEGAPLPAGW